MTTKPTDRKKLDAEELKEDALADVVGGGTIDNNFEERKSKRKGYIGETEKNLRNSPDRDATALMEEEGNYW